MFEIQSISMNCQRTELTICAVGYVVDLVTNVEGSQV